MQNPDTMDRGKFLEGRPITARYLPTDQLKFYKAFIRPSNHRPVFHICRSLYLNSPQTRRATWSDSQHYYYCVLRLCLQLARQVRSDAVSCHGSHNHDATALRYDDFDGCWHGLAGGCSMLPDGRDVLLHSSSSSSSSR